VVELNPGNPEAEAAHGELMRLVTAFRDANDARLDEIERRMSADVVTIDKVERLSAALDRQQAKLDQLQLKLKRPPLAAIGDSQRQGSAGREGREHKSAFESYVRRGDAAALLALESKALSAGSGPDGGYLVPEETESQIGRLLLQASPMRRLASVRQVTAMVYKKPLALAGAATGWVGETAARPQTNSPSLIELQFPAMEIYAMPAATQTLLDDAAVDIDQWIAEEVQLAFAAQEGEAFITGDGQNRPRGFLDQPKVADAAWSWGNLGYIGSGAAGGFSATNASDQLISLVYALKSQYRQNASFMMNRRTQAAIRKLKDSAGTYLWQPAAAASTSPTLMNFPVAEAEAMPDIAADSFAIAFGDFRSGYLIVDRIGVRVLRDPYSAKPYVLFYTTKRVGGGVQNFEAIKLMKFGTT
jgi:HK97 family phage major capsid protein